MGSAAGSGWRADAEDVALVQKLHGYPSGFQQSRDEVYPLSKLVGHYEQLSTHSIPDFGGERRADADYREFRAASAAGLA